jgi:hypothetical protein
MADGLLLWWQQNAAMSSTNAAHEPFAPCVPGTRACGLSSGCDLVIQCSLFNATCFIANASFFQYIFEIFLQSFFDSNWMSRTVGGGFIEFIFVMLFH